MTALQASYLLTVLMLACVGMFGACCLIALGQRKALHGFAYLAAGSVYGGFGCFCAYIASQLGA